MYALKRNSDGAYVAQLGSASSYTRDVKQARQFPTREAAERDRCGNEYLVILSYSERAA